jgi:hypothetical protein
MTTDIHDPGWIQTFSGHRVWPFVAAHPENVFCIEDVAHSLSMLCRFTGHVRKFYSVAEHCVLCSLECDPAVRLETLMHDAGEMCFGDINRPVKVNLLFRSAISSHQLRLAVMEKRLLEAMLRQMGLPPITASKVEPIKAIDNAMLVREAMDLLPGGMHPAWSMHPSKGHRPADIRPRCWPPEIAERMFLERFGELTVPATAGMTA